MPELLNAFRTQSPTSPRLTWYGRDSERVELSGRVLENWVAKTANLLVDELDAESGTVVALDLPIHWRSIVWLLATWALQGTVAVEGCPVVLKESGLPSRMSHANIVATQDPESAQHLASITGSSPYVVAVGLPALAMQWNGTLPQGALDYAGEVRACSDVFFPEGAADSEVIAWDSPTSSQNYQGLFAYVPPAPSRVLVTAENGWESMIPQIVGIWAAGGSVVLLDDGVEDTAHLRSVEAVSI